MAREGGKDPTGTLGVRVYLQPSPSTDGQLLMRSLLASKSQSSFLYQLAMRGWINLLHGTTAEERSIQARAMGLPDTLIAEIDALVATPQLFALRHRDSAAIGVSDVPAIPAEVVAPPPAPPPSPLPAPEEPEAFVLPANSRLGLISMAGGLS